MAHEVMHRDRPARGLHFHRGLATVGARFLDRHLMSLKAGYRRKRGFEPQPAFLDQAQAATVAIGLVME